MNPPSAAPIGRAPAFTARKIDDTRPSIAEGVTVWRKVVDVIVHRIGPAPNRKNDAPATRPLGNAMVPTIVSPATTETAGPTSTAWPNDMRANTNLAPSAPTTMPMPKHASVKPTSRASRPSARTAHGTYAACSTNHERFHAMAV